MPQSVSFLWHASSNDWVWRVLLFQHKSYKALKESWERKSRGDGSSHCQTARPVLLWEAALGMHCHSSAASGTSSNTEGVLSLPWSTSGVFCLLPRSSLLGCHRATEDSPKSSCKSSSVTALHHHMPHQYPDHHSPLMEDPEDLAQNAKCIKAQTSIWTQFSCEMSRGLWSWAISVAFCPAPLSHRAGHNIIPAFSLAQGITICSPALH